MLVVEEVEMLVVEEVESQEEVEDENQGVVEEDGDPNGLEEEEEEVVVVEVGEMPEQEVTMNEKMVEGEEEGALAHGMLEDEVGQHSSQ